MDYESGVVNEPVDLESNVIDTKMIETNMIENVELGGRKTDTKDNDVLTEQEKEKEKEKEKDESEELQEEIKKMMERNRTYAKIADVSKSIFKPKTNKNAKPLRRAITKFKNISKNVSLKRQITKGKQMEEEMINEISTKRKETRKKLEERRAKKIEGELRVGKMTVIKDISKIRKCDKKLKDKIYRLPNEIINKILKKQ